MADYSDAADAAADALANVDPTLKRYRYKDLEKENHSPVDAVKGAAMLEALASRRSSGFLRVAKMREPQS